jgi:hypothetical protein
MRDSARDLGRNEPAVDGWLLHASDDIVLIWTKLAAPLIMGAYKYIGELYKKKQSDVLRFLLRVRCVHIMGINGVSERIH